MRSYSKAKKPYCNWTPGDILSLFTRVSTHPCKKYKGGKTPHWEWQQRETGILKSNTNTPCLPHYHNHSLNSKSPWWCNLTPLPPPSTHIPTQQPPQNSYWWPFCDWFCCSVTLLTAMGLGLTVCKDTDLMIYICRNVADAPHSSYTIYTAHTLIHTTHAQFTVHLAYTSCNTVQITVYPGCTHLSQINSGSSTPLTTHPSYFSNWHLLHVTVMPIVLQVLNRKTT